MHLGIGNATAARAWRQWRQLRLRESFKFSTDPELVGKVTDMVALYLNVPEKSIVLCVDEKSQIQALNRTAPMRPGGSKRTHDYTRYGTTTLYATLEITTGNVTGACKPKHRRQGFPHFLKFIPRVTKVLLAKGFTSPRTNLLGAAQPSTSRAGPPLGDEQLRHPQNS